MLRIIKIGAFRHVLSTPEEAISGPGLDRPVIPELNRALVLVPNPDGAADVDS